MPIVQIPAAVIELAKDFAHSLRRDSDGGKRVTKEEAEELLRDVQVLAEHLTSAIAKSA